MFEQIEINSTINIIGPGGSGKTTYLAVLAYHASRLARKIPQLKIELQGHAISLKGVVEDIITNQKRSTPTDANKEPKEFQFNVELPSLIKGKSTSLFVKDYAGELFKQVGTEVPKGKSLRDHLPENVKKFLDDLLVTQNWMIILSDLHKEEHEQAEKDVEYKNSIFNLLEELNTWEADNKDKPKKRIALVMAKCERGELWSGRLDPEEDIFELRFPETYKVLTQRKYHPNRIKYFACSSYGVLGDKDPRPNRIIPDYSSATRAYLRQKEPWEPYGLFSPVYWLITGKMLADESL